MLPAIANAEGFRPAQTHEVSEEGWKLNFI